MLLRVANESSKLSPKRDHVGARISPGYPRSASKSTTTSLVVKSNDDNMGLEEIRASH
jgi:hypothetical protein